MMAAHSVLRRTARGYLRRRAGLAAAAARLQQEAERKEMQVAGIRRVGARAEMIEVGEPRRLASDEALLEVRAAGVASWDEFVRTGGWDVAGRRWRWALRQPARCCQRTRRSVTGRPAMR